MAVFAVAIAAGDFVKYQSFVYGSFVWEIHVRYNNIPYFCRKLGKISQNLSSAAVVIGDLRVKPMAQVS